MQVSVWNQVAALCLMLSCSAVIAFVPLVLLQYVFRKKRRRLRQEEFRSLSQQSNSGPSSVWSEETSDIPTENIKRSDQKSFFSWCFAFSTGHYRTDSHKLHHPRRNSSQRSASTISGHHQVSELALTSTLKIPSIILELIRSLDGGLLLATLFLVLMPQLRNSFESFMQVHVHSTHLKYPNQPQPMIRSQTSVPLTPANFTTSALYHHSHRVQLATAIDGVPPEAPTTPPVTIVSKNSPIPLVELILCLAFFALYFAEEFAQLCLRYRKYFWACNSSIVYSSSDGTCEFTSLDYRISKTKRFLIDCSRKTSSSQTISTRTSNSSTPKLCLGEKTSKVIENRIVSTNQPESALDHANSVQFSKTTCQVDSQVSTRQKDANQNEDLVCDNHNLHDSLQFTYANVHHRNAANQSSNVAIDYEPNSLLSASSSVHLPSYYWHQHHSHHQSPMTSSLYSAHHQHHHMHHSHHHHHHHHHQQRHSQSHTQSDLPISRHHQYHHRSTQPFPPVDLHESHMGHCSHDQCRGDQDDKSVEDQTHKDSFAHQDQSECESLEFQHPQHCCCCTDRHQFHYYSQYPNPSLPIKNESSSIGGSSLGSSAIFTKIFLPYTTLATSTPALYIGEGILVAIQPSAAMLWLMLAVMLVHKLVTGLLVSFELHEKTTGRQRHLPVPTTVLFIALPTIGYLFVMLINGLSFLKSISSDSTGESVSMQLAAVRVILFAISSATLLHLVLLVIQRNLVQFQPQFQLPKSQPERRFSFGQQSPPVSLSATAAPADSVQPTNTSATTTFNIRNFTETFSADKPTPTEPKTSSPLPVPTELSPQTAEELSRPTTDSNRSNASLPRDYCDPEIVTNPPRYGVLHHFTMYTGFIIVLMAIAFLNMKSLKI